jgi:hypothetical protein
LIKDCRLSNKFFKQQWINCAEHFIRNSYRGAATGLRLLTLSRFPLFGNMLIIVCCQFGSNVPVNNMPFKTRSSAWCRPQLPNRNISKTNLSVIGTHSRQTLVEFVQAKWWNAVTSICTSKSVRTITSRMKNVSQKFREL